MKTPHTTPKVLDQTDARVDALGVELSARLSALREELAAFPPEASRVPSCFAESEGRLAAAIADLNAAVVDLRSVLHAEA